MNIIWSYPTQKKRSYMFYSTYWKSLNLAITADVFYRLVCFNRLNFTQKMFSEVVSNRLICPSVMKSIYGWDYPNGCSCKNTYKRPIHWKEISEHDQCFKALQKLEIVICSCWFCVVCVIPLASFYFSAYPCLQFWARWSLKNHSMQQILW